MWLNTLRQSVAVLIGLCFATAEAAATETGPAPQMSAPPVGQWEYQITPYGWLIGMNGQETIAGHRLDVDATFLDIVENSDSLAALMGHFEARNGRLAFYGDAVYADVTLSGDVVEQRNPIAGLDISVGADVGVDYELFILEGGVTYEIFRWQSGESWNDAGAPKVTALDIVAGGRYWHQKAEATLAITGTVDLSNLGLRRSGDLALARSGSVDWFDPLMGLRLRHQVAPGKRLFVQGDIGGFGVGSDFTWQVFGGYAWDTGHTLFGAPVSGTVGYRALYADYEQGSGNSRFAYDMLLHGPVLGLTLRY